MKKIKQKIIKEENLLDAGRIKPLRSASSCRAFYPENIIEVKRIVNESIKNKVPITFSGAKTGLNAGIMPYEEAIILSTEKLFENIGDLKNYKKISNGIFLNKNKTTCIVSAGVVLKKLILALDKENLFYAPHPGEVNAFLCGNVATNASGPRTFGFGPTRDHVKALWVMLPNGKIFYIPRGKYSAENWKIKLDGKIINLPKLPNPKVKNSAGVLTSKNMDLIDLFIGTEGIFGLILQAEVGISPKKEIMSYIYSFNKEKKALAFAENLQKFKFNLKRQKGIISLEFIDSNSLKLFSKNNKLPFSMESSLVEVEYLKGDKKIEKIIKRAKKSFKVNKEYGEEVIKIVRYGIPSAVRNFLKKNNMKKLGTDFAVPVSKFKVLLKIYKKAEKDFKKFCPKNSAPATAMWGHIGDQHLHFNFLPDSVKNWKKAEKIYDKLLNVPLMLGGTISAEHGCGRKTVRDPKGNGRSFLSFLYSEKEMNLLNKLKKDVDPMNLFNRGVMVGDSKKLKYKSIIFDFDSTIVCVESLDFLADLSLKNNPNKKQIIWKIKDITNSGMNGEISFDESLAKRMALMAPTRDQVLEAGKQITKFITKSFLDNEDFFNTNAENIYVVSGGFEEMILPTIKKLGIPAGNVFANKFKFNKFGRVIGVDSSRLTSEHLGKVKQLKALSLPMPAIIIGDGYTDYEIKESGIAENFIAYTEHIYRKNVALRSDFQARSFLDVLKIII
ncbi:MAG: HAD-IB family phosphatase [Patescibacteria group bacterium]